MRDITFITVWLFVCNYVVVCQVIPGLSPSKPNRILKSCMAQSGPVNSNPVYNNQPANSVNEWCRSYSNALPCVTKNLPQASKSDPNDWYLNLVFDEEYANNSSKAVCSRLQKYGNKMSCLTSDINQAEMCVSMLTSPIADFLHKIYQSNKTTDNTSNENALRACLIPVTATKCFKPFFQTCKTGIQKLMARYFMILSGKCLKIAKEKDTTPEPTDQADDKPQKVSDVKSTKVSDDKSTKVSDDKSTKVSEDKSIKTSDDKSTKASDDVPAKISDDKQKIAVVIKTEQTTQASAVTQTVQTSEELDDIPEPSTEMPVRSIQSVEQTTVSRDDHEDQTTKHARQLTIIQRVIESDSDIEPETVENTKSIKQIPDQQFIQRKDQISQTTQNPMKKVAEDIYIPDSQILSAMKTLPENEIVNPDEEEEDEIILSAFNNSTDSTDSDDTSEERGITSTSTENTLELTKLTTESIPMTSVILLMTTTEATTKLTAKTTKTPVLLSKKHSHKGDSSGLTLSGNQFLFATLTVLSVAMNHFYS